MKEPRTDGRPPTDASRETPEPELDPMVGAQSGVPETPSPMTRIDAEPGAPDDLVDPSQERVDQNLETPELRPAVLGAREGIGLLRVTRSAEGTVVGVDGTWRPGDDAASSAELRSAFPEGATVRFAGTRVEARGANREEVVVDVVIDRHGTYETDDGRTLHIVGFTPRTGATEPPA